MPGGTILPIYDAMFGCEKPQQVLVRHEQVGGHAAEGFALATGKVGVCFGTSGPGATNLVTAIADAYMDSVPLVAITGNVATSLIGSDAFQEADITGITMPITKHNWLVTDVHDLPRILKEAFYIARTGRPGPVLVDIPKDIQNTEFEFEYPDSVSIPGYHPPVREEPRLKDAATLIRSASRPIIYLGGGVRTVRRPRRRWRPSPSCSARRWSPRSTARGPSRRPARSASACSACTAASSPTTPCRTPTCSSPWAPASTTASPASSPPSPPRPRWSTSTSTRPRSPSWSPPPSRWWAT